MSWVIPAALGIVGAVARLLASDLIRRKWPRLHRWLTDYRGVTVRWTVLSVVMFGVASFVVVMALSTAAPSRRQFLWGFAGLIAALAVFFAELGRRALRQATLEGRRRR